MYLNKYCKFINSYHDLYGIVDEEVYKALEQLCDDELNGNSDIIKDLKSELDVYTDENYNCRKLLGDAELEIEKVIDYMKEAKRLDKRKAINELERIVDCIVNGEI